MIILVVLLMMVISYMQFVGKPLPSFAFFLVNVVSVTAVINVVMGGAA